MLSLCFKLLQIHQNKTHKLTLGLELLWLGKTLYLLGSILEGLPRLLGMIDTGGIFADRLLGAILGLLP